MQNSDESFPDTTLLVGEDSAEPCTRIHGNAALADRLGEIGERWVGVCIMCLGIGGVTVSIFFPHLQGAGMNTTTLIILIPIWTIGIVGLLFLLASWILCPYRHDRLGGDRLFDDRRPDGRILSPWIKALGAFTTIIALVGCIGLFGERAEGPRWFPYFILPVLGFLLYLCCFFDEKRHRASTTYLNRLYIVPAVLLVSLVWPLLIVFLVQDRIARR